MNDVIEKARELGVLIQKDERYAAYYTAKEANDKDEERLTELDDGIKSLYGTIMANENMINYNKAKNAMDSLLNQINMIITYSANGEDPLTCSCEEVNISCSGNCSACGGCH